jgi:hypothetical protein
MNDSKVDVAGGASVGRDPLPVSFPVAASQQSTESNKPLQRLAGHPACGYIPLSKTLSGYTLRHANQLSTLLMDDNKKDWTQVSRALQRRHSDTTMPLNPERPLEVPQKLGRALESGGNSSAVEKPDGFIANYKANKIEREAAIDHLKVWYQSQLEVAKHQLHEVVRVRKAQASIQAEQFLRSLDQQHLEYLADLGLRNMTTRQRMLLELGDQTSSILAEVVDRDWPPEMMEQTVMSIIELRQRHFDKIMQELGRSDH